MGCSRRDPSTFLASGLVWEIQGAPFRTSTFDGRLTLKRRDPQMSPEIARDLRFFAVSGSNVFAVRRLARLTSAPRQWNHPFVTYKNVILPLRTRQEGAIYVTAGFHPA